MSANATAPIRVDIWSDIACPWCAIGAARFDEAVRRVEARAGDAGEAPSFEVKFHAFELDPTAESTDLSHTDDLARRKSLTTEQVRQMFERVAQAGAEDGLSFDFDRVRTAPTRLGHQLIAFAADRGKQREAVDALHHAYFTEGADMASVDDLVAVAERIGLDADEARAALASEDYATRVDIDLDEARRLGVSGVPFFVFDQKYAFSGAQPAETVVQVIDHVLAERASEQATAEGQDAGDGQDGDGPASGSRSGSAFGPAAG